ncbi:hypothetical protein DFH11DRAFT_1606724 [Phellopilus nigrolimitatus]|nr:hypothetical protein DFH11DRAFT_1606724 [Phellopilus nigrolimitatus]
MPWIYHTLYLVLVIGRLAGWLGRRSDCRGCTSFYQVSVIDFFSHRCLHLVGKCRLIVGAFFTGAAAPDGPPHEAQASESGESVKGEVEWGRRSFVGWDLRCICSRFRAVHASEKTTNCL